MAKGTKFKIKHLRFEYRIEAPDPGNPGEKMYLTREAKQNEEVELTLDADIERGRRHGAFYTDEELKRSSGEAAAPATAAEKTDQELIDWLMEEKPNINETVAAAGGDPVVAQRVLDAESAATGGEPRDGVVKGLAKAIEAEG